MQHLIEHLEMQIGALEQRGCLWVAYSGGVDSSLLLYLAMQTCWGRAGRVRAIHIHHWLQSVAERWVEHCRTQCASYGVPLQVEVVRVPQGASLEAQARRARYAAFERHLAADDLLLLGQHQDDQAETLLLRLLRGAGERGAGAMPKRRALANGRLLRPLLELSRAEIERLAQEAALAWIEDPSNRDTRLLRNYVRHDVMPVLRKQWPQAGERLAVHAAQQQRQLALLDEYTAEDARWAYTNPGWSLERMAGWSVARQLQLLSWLLRQVSVSLPERSRLESFRQQLFSAAPDRHPSLCWQGWCFVRFQHQLRLHRELLPFDTPVTLRFVAGEQVDLPGGVLCVDQADTPLAIPEGGMLQVAPRRGGEQLRVAGHRRLVKKMLQSAALPPWLRDQLPLVWYDAQLVAVADHWLDERYRADPAAGGLGLHWRPRTSDFQLSGFDGSANL